ncbi:MAG: anaerobic ribonucleoside-triphosphate reductase [Candidatus Nanoarchaeia archaeon]|jgi:ribonucleoside-triphosphate reductase|nr:anaerobic ribonucleoside-triphosphate reductase [Candidatus Nanoarchaeia archaeon]
MHNSTSIAQASNLIYKTLENRLREYYKIPENKLEETTNNILKIHGLDKDSFSIINQYEELEEGNLNDITIDDNANKEKTVSGIFQEAVTPIKKTIGYRALYRKMNELYGKKEASYLTSLMYDYTLAISDSGQIKIPYCWSFDASKLISFGKPFGQLPSKPVKRVDSYISLLNEVVHQMSNSLAGAIAVGSFLLDITHLLLLKENKTIEDLKNIEYRKYIENQFQRIVHGFNSLSRSGGSESPFTNISLFDREKLKKLVGEEYLWYYQDDSGNLKYDVNYIIEFIIELQNIFMEFFDKGDPCNNGMPYRFPVVTLNVSKKKNKDGNWIIEDKQFLKSICKKDIYRYNIFVSEGNKIASCCRLWSDKDKIDLASQANSFGAGGSISLGSHRVVCINFARLALIAKSKEEYHQLIKDSTLSCKKILKAHKLLLQDSTKRGLQHFLKIGWIQLDKMFSTIGIIGYVEADEILKKKLIYTKNEDAIKDSLFILNNNLDINKEDFNEIFINVEQVPAEAMAHRLPRADKLLFNDKIVSYNLYANQFIPLWDNQTTVWDKMKIDGKYLSMLTGGGISHITVGEHITSKQAEKLINFAVESNCEHFAINSAFCKCENGHVTIGNKDLCPICSGKIIEKISRVVGFFTNVKDWSFYKREYDFKRRKEFKNGDFEINQ